LRVRLSATGGPCASPKTLFARVGSEQSDALAVSPTGTIDGAIMIGQPVALIEGTAEQTGAPENVVDIQAVVGTGSAQRICARMRLVPPLPGSPAGTKGEFHELLVAPSSGCVKFGD